MDEPTPLPSKEKKKHRGNVQNLIPNQWKKGQSGNPKGRPLGSLNMHHRIKQALHKAAQQGGGDRIVADEVVETLVNMAKSGDGKFMQMLLDRCAGPVTQRVEFNEMPKPVLRWDVTRSNRIDVTNEHAESVNGNGNGKRTD